MPRKSWNISPINQFALVYHSFKVAHQYKTCTNDKSSDFCIQPQRCLICICSGTVKQRAKCQKSEKHASFSSFCFVLSKHENNTKQNHGKHCSISIRCDFGTVKYQFVIFAWNHKILQFITNRHREFNFCTKYSLEFIICNKKYRKFYYKSDVGGTLKRKWKVESNWPIMILAFDENNVSKD